jgi:hypothetical protein
MSAVTESRGQDDGSLRIKPEKEEAAGRWLEQLNLSVK